jgi:hypothetical protein
MTSNKRENLEKDFSTMEIQGQFLNSDMLEQKIVPLLEERLMVELAQRKTGEIVVRKEIETHIITVNIPVRNEKIIVEQVSPIYKKIAEVNLGEFTSFNQNIQDKNNSEIVQLLSSQEPILEGNITSRRIIKGDFDSLEDAHRFLDLIFSQVSRIEGLIRVEVIPNN